MSDTEEKPATPTRPQMVGGSAVALGIAVFVLQPLLRFVDPGLLPWFGALVVALLVLVGTLRFEKQPRSRRLLHSALIMLPTALVLFAAMDAMKASAWNDMRCARIQAAMLHPTTQTRDDLPSIFQALGCRPVGEFPRDPALPSGGPKGPPLTPEQEAAHQRFLQQRLDAELEIDKPAPALNTSAGPHALFQKDARFGTSSDPGEHGNRNTGHGAL